VARAVGGNELSNSPLARLLTVLKLSKGRVALPPHFCKYSLKLVCFLAGLLSVDVIVMSRRDYCTQMSKYMRCCKAKELSAKNPDIR
jgi:hypothetical protein